MNNKFLPSYGNILVLSDKSESTYSGVELAAPTQDLTSGLVIAVGRLPRQYRPVVPGDRIVYARGVITSVEIEINGKPESCRIVTVQDYRGRYSNNEKSRFSLYVFGAGFAAGAILSTPIKNMARYFVKAKAIELLKALREKMGRLSP